MKKEKQSVNFSMPFIAVLVLAFTVSLAMSYFFLRGKFSFDTSFIDEIGSRPSSTNGTEHTDAWKRLYEHSEDGSPDLALAEDALKKYLQDFHVRLLDLYMDRDDIVYIDIGSEMRKNFKGDAAEELSILAGLYNTVRTSLPDLAAIRVLIDGHEAETLGGHIDISGPLRKDIAENI